DGQGATLTVPVQTNAEFTLVLEAEHGIRTEYPGGALVVREDQPPAYVGKEIEQKKDPVNARAFDRIPIEARLADDVAVAGAEVLKAVNKEDEKSEPMTLDGAGKLEAVARLQWILAGKVKEGDVVRYRIRFRDNYPKEYGGPHVRHYPEDGWLQL